MTPEALARHLPLPVGIGFDGRLLSLSDYLSAPEKAVPPDSLDDDQKIGLAKARWSAGEWSDILYGTEGLIDRDRAIAEIEAKNPIGFHLLQIEMRAIEMAKEDASKALEAGQ